MIAALLQPWAGPLLALGVPLLALFFVSRALRLRRRVEFQRQLLELLHLATSREQSLAPMLGRAAAEARRPERQWLQQIAVSLGNGASLAAALAGGAERCFPGHLLAAIAAAEGTARLPVVLGDLARRQDHARALRYRVLLAASYPALLSLLLLCLGSFWAFASWSRALADVHRIQLGPWIVAAAVAFGGVWSLLAFGWGHGRWSRVMAALLRRLPWLGARLRLLPAERALRATATLIASGSRLPAALRQAAHTAADETCARNFTEAAELADAGALPAEIWRRTGLPGFVTARLLTCRTSSEQLATCLTDLSEQCHRRCSDAIHRAVGVLQPVVVVGFGLLVALQFSDVFAWLDVCRTQAMEQMPW